MCSPEECVATARRMAELGLVVGSFGNVSCRDDGKILITSAHLDYSQMGADDIVVLDQDGTRLEGGREPSSEFRLHLAIYRVREDVRAVVHTHSIYALALSLIAAELPVITEEMEHRVPGVPYAPAGSQKLAERAARALGKEGEAAILERHGVVGVGANLGEALLVCQLVERNAQVYLLTEAKGITPSSPSA